MGLVALVVGVGLLGFVAERLLVARLGAVVTRLTGRRTGPSRRTARRVAAATTRMLPRPPRDTGIPSLPLLCGQPVRPKPRSEQTRLLGVDGVLPVSPAATERLARPGGRAAGRG